MNELTDSSAPTDVAGADQPQSKNGQPKVRPQGQPGTLADVLRDVIGVIEGPADLAEQHDYYAHGTPKR